MSLLVNILLLVGIIYLIVQCYKDLREFLKDDNDTFKD